MSSHVARDPIVIADFPGPEVVGEPIEFALRPVQRRLPVQTFREGLVPRFTVLTDPNESRTPVSITLGR